MSIKVYSVVSLQAKRHTDLTSVALQPYSTPWKSHSASFFSLPPGGALCHSAMLGTNVCSPGDHRCSPFKLRPFAVQSTWQLPHSTNTSMNTSSFSCKPGFPSATMTSTSFYAHPLIDDVLRLTGCDSRPILLALRRNVDSHVMSMMGVGDNGSVEDMEEMETNNKSPLSVGEDSQCRRSPVNEDMRSASEVRPIRSASAAAASHQVNSIVDTNVHRERHVTKERGT